MENTNLSKLQHVCEIMHQILNSFPTRRSSDLRAEALLGAGNLAVMRGDLTGSEARYEECISIVREDRRSEEHTSELQSRLHLVCRLLLEKKKGFRDYAPNAYSSSNGWSVFYQ